MFTYETLWTAPVVPFASVEEEAATLRAARSGDEDSTLRVLLAYRPVMLAVVRDYSPEARPVARQTAADSEDYRSAAVMGLLAAVHAWEEARHPSLAGIVRQYVNQYVAAEAGTSASFDVPERTLKRFFGIARRAGYNREEGAKLAPRYEMAAETFLSIFDRVWVDSMDGGEDASEEDGGRWDMEDPRLVGAAGSGDDVADVEDRILVRMAFAAVDEQETKVCRMAYGFEGDPLPDAEIAHQLGIPTRRTAQRVRTRALDKMRAALGA